MVRRFSVNGRRAVLVTWYDPQEMVRSEVAASLDAEVERCCEAGDIMALGEEVVGDDALCP